RSADDPSLMIGLDLIAHRRAAVVAFFAPSQVTALADLLAARAGGLDVLDAAVVAAIGPTTAAALAERGVRAAAGAVSPAPPARGCPPEVLATPDPPPGPEAPKGGAGRQAPRAPPLGRQPGLSDVRGARLGGAEADPVDARPVQLLDRQGGRRRRARQRSR